MCKKSPSRRPRGWFAPFAGSAAALLIFLSGGCAWWANRSERSEGPGTVRESELQALAIAPTVDYATAMDLGDGRRLHHSERDLFYVEGDQFYPVVVRGYPLVAGVAPGGEAVAFLEPIEFERATNVYVFDIPARTLHRLTDHADESSTLSVKAAHWLDDRTIYYLQGYRYGTASRGGDLWRVDLGSMKREPVVELMGNGQSFEEIVEFEFVPSHKLIRYVVARYNDYGEEIRTAQYCTLEGKSVQ